MFFWDTVYIVGLLEDLDHWLRVGLAYVCWQYLLVLYLVCWAIRSFDSKLSTNLLTYFPFLSLSSPPLPLILVNFSLKIWHLVTTILMIFPRINCPKFIRFVWRRHTKFQIGMAAAPIPAMSLPLPLSCDDFRQILNWFSKLFNCCEVYKKDCVGLTLPTITPKICCHSGTT